MVTNGKKYTTQLETKSFTGNKEYTYHLKISEKTPGIMTALEKKETATPSSSKKNKYYIIVSSLPTANDAQQVLNEYKQKGYKDVTIIEGNGRYRLSLCNFADKAAAYKKLNELKQNDAFKNAWILSSK